MIINEKGAKKTAGVLPSMEIPKKIKDLLKSGHF